MTDFFVNLDMGKWKDSFDMSFFIGLISNISGKSWRELQLGKNVVYDAKEVDLRPIPKIGSKLALKRIVEVVEKWIEHPDLVHLKMKFIVTQSGIMKDISLVNFPTTVDYLALSKDIEALKLEWVPASKDQKRVNTYEIIHLKNEAI